MLDSDDIYRCVAVCPIDADLIQRLVAAAELPPADYPVRNPELLRLGFLRDEGILVDDARFRTPQGHMVYGDDCLAMPFAYGYFVGGELNPEDFWGTLPGWTSRPDPDHTGLHTEVDAAIAAFTVHLGIPHKDVRISNHRAWRYAAWRIGGQLLVVGEGPDAFSYGQNENAMVYIREHGIDAPIPDAVGFGVFISW